MRGSEKAKKAKTGSGAPQGDAEAGGDSQKKRDGATQETENTVVDKVPVKVGEDEKKGEKKEKPADGKGAAGDAKTEEEKLQETLKAAYDRGLPAVVVFGSQSAKDTEKLLNTLNKNMKEHKADFIYADTDKLDANSELGQVARRSEERGLGLGADGKADLAFTGVYKVEKGADGKYHIGNSVATFWGGRPEIANIMNDQLRFATRDVSGSGAPSTDRVIPPAPAADGSRPATDGGSADSNSEAARAKKDAQEKAAREKAERDAARVKELTQLPYTLDKFAAGWAEFIDSHGMEKGGGFRDLTNEFGQEVLKGQFDGDKLKGLMDQSKGLTQEQANTMLGQVNEKLSQSGLTVQATVGNDGKINELSISDVTAGQGKVSVVVDKNGNVTSYKGLGRDTQGDLAADALRIAKKAAPDACP